MATPPWHRPTVVVVVGGATRAIIQTRHEAEPLITHNNMELMLSAQIKDKVGHDARWLREEYSRVHHYIKTS